MRQLADLAKDCGGRLIGADRAFSSVNTDTRTVTSGQLFVALRGPRFDGNAYLAEAAAKGAVGAIAEREGPTDFPIVLVDDALVALQRAAQRWRSRFTMPLIGVAGSNGKTTSKEMIASILSCCGETLATAGNLNNHIGVPLTLLRLDSSHRHAVIEMGANHAGELAQLAGFASPVIGIVTNAGAEHLEGFGSLEGAARAEGELFAALDQNGTAILNADDSFAGLWRDMTVARIVTFGLGSKADFSARDIRTEVGAEGFLTRFTLVSPAGEKAISLHLAGKHNVINALGAAAAASAAGATLDHIATGLSRMRPVKGRLQLRSARQGAWIIDDSYNANPSSLQAAIDVLEALGGRRFLVLGEMGELGNFSREAHLEAGRYARSHGVERLFAVGEATKRSVESFGEGAVWHDDAAALTEAVSRELASDVRVLVKGSRSNRLERVVAALESVSSPVGVH
ncbi:MAG: UDP-N-acetylmuramoyl-tripeptide--D-alanyl-D-alanine ligase [Gammaproteobacteria bacterium]|jgi:UDP-N-acetylmuramoyl-tripeptide--D-alanyl-D-alanine ligase|nr:UDP-N-acetylmuramoyl-tripeptide--D-alanyl-D-alanine ligase [Gammaproteobacteria bacterium]